ncbi:hypothetical protein EYF80_003609 [Liparis tanakae]|uniref:Uncharacterized protein n=1 Tax=Liparis tanakae TaxID=230148 RepID=A0A4Z2J9V2_9TELE|nr:hypothetical protein EYF80_003609 [Liparis tanakae]
MPRQSGALSAAPDDPDRGRSGPRTPLQRASLRAAGGVYLVEAGARRSRSVISSLTMERCINTADIVM